MGFISWNAQNFYAKPLYKLVAALVINASVIVRRTVYFNAQHFSWQYKVEYVESKNNLRFYRKIPA